MTLSVDRRLGDAATDDDGAIGAHNAAIHRRLTRVTASSSCPSSTAGVEAASAWLPLPPSAPQRRLGNVVTDDDGAISAHDAAIHHNLTRVTASSSCPSSPAEVGAASAWLPLPPSAPQRRRVHTTTFTDDSVRSGTMSWPPWWMDAEARKEAQQERLIRLLHHVQSLPPRHDHDSGANAYAPPPAPAASVPRIPSPPRSVGTSASSTTIGSVAPPTTHQDQPQVLFNLNYGHLGYSSAVLLALYGGLNDLLSGWNHVLKVCYIILLILGIFTLGSGLMASTAVVPTTCTHRISFMCSRLCSCLATFVFIVAVACNFGSRGYIAGIVFGAAAVSCLLWIWIEGDPTTYDACTRVWAAIKKVWKRMKRCGQRGPLLP